MRHRLPAVFVVLGFVLAMPALAEQQSVRWHQDLESAKLAAKQSGRLVLVHFWTPSCAPCLALDQNVFNQAGVAAALETNYVPVKLNADENSATAQWFGITRVPMDVIVTPDGQIVGKLISPPTPAAYVAEVTAVAGKYSSTAGQAFAKAAAEAPVQPQINSAYAKLQVAPNTPPALAAPSANANTDRYALATPAASTSLPPLGSAPVNRSQPLASQHIATQPTASQPTATQPAAPQLVARPATQLSHFGQPAAAPIGLAPNTPPQVASAPAQVAVKPSPIANPYTSPMTSPPAAPQTVAAPPISPALTTPIGAENSTVRFGSPTSSNVPPLAAAGSPPPAGWANPALPGAVPDPRQLPPGAPPLGFEGYCPVSMRNSWKWMPGNPQWGIVHRGRTYWFASQEAQQQFWTDPDRYTPALSGIDPVLSLDHQQQVPGKREHSIDYDGLFYMFASEATLQQFTANPQRYSANVRQAMGIPRGRLVR